jgi:hypothetical protein
MNTSKKPRMGARFFFPLEMKIMRNVPRLTSATLAMKTIIGIST